MYSNGNGDSNTAIGFDALYDNTVGEGNTAVGSSSGPNTYDLDNTSAVGWGATTTASNQVRIGNSSVTSIGGYANWSNISDLRFKKEIKEDVKGLEFINQLRPVSYILDKEAIDKFLGIPDSIALKLKEKREPPVRETGFIAQESGEDCSGRNYIF